MSENQTSTFDKISHILNPIGHPNSAVYVSEGKNAFCKLMKTANQAKSLNGPAFKAPSILMRLTGTLSMSSLQKLIT